MLFTIIEKGGLAVYPLLLASIIALTIIFERLYATRRERVLPRDLDLQLTDLVRSGRRDEAMLLCRRSDSALAKVLATGIRYLGKERKEILEAVELAGRRELTNLQRYIGLLGTIAAVAPLLGLLGTVMGIIRTFATIEENGIGNPQLLAGGISEALIATAAGICIAVPAVIFYRYFLGRIRNLALEMEERAHHVLFSAD